MGLRVVLLSLLFIGSNIYGIEYNYREVTGDNIENVVINISENLMTYKSESYSSVISYKEGKTDSVKTDFLKNGKSTSFYRKGKNIYDKYNKLVTAEKKDPWIEDTTNLKFFIDSPEKEYFFFVVGPDYKMDGTIKEGKYSRMDLRIVKEEFETLEIDGEKVKCQKIMMTTKNKFMSAFWKAYYWYRVEDGILVYYEDKKGPGTPRTYGTLYQKGNS